MTVNRKTILALGLVLCVFAAGKSVLAAPAAACGSPSCEASCGTSDKSSGDASCDGACKSDCNAGCNTGRRTRTWCAEDDPAFGACASCFDELCETCRNCSVKVEVSSLFIHRASPGTQTVLLDPASGAGLYDLSRQEFPYAAGPRVSATVLDCEGWGLEFNYFGIDGWSATSDISNRSLPNGVGNLIVDDVNQISLADAHFESIARLYSTEVNFRKPLFGHISCLAGFRWLELIDRYWATGTSATTANTVSDMITTHNNLYGFQVGADGILGQEADRWRLKGFVKGGIFLNDADQATSISDPGNLGNFAVNNNQIGAAFFGETGITGYFQITKHLAASGGYQVMFVNGVAQPANQLSGTSIAKSTATIDATSGLFYHGASAGLEVAW